MWCSDASDLLSVANNRSVAAIVYDVCASVAARERILANLSDLVANVTEYVDADNQSGIGKRQCSGIKHVCNDCKPVFRMEPDTNNV